MNVNFSIPVTLSNYRQSDNTLYSFAKLKIFYIGETPDKRLFTKKFSDKLLTSLPYVPVVGYYSYEKEDFVGHNPAVQHIYGIVPEDTKLKYVKENGKEYAVCDVILYTGRVDDTGEIAQKIVGKSHSLELNPRDTKYKMNKDSNGKLINIEFTSGSLLGLSVLGDNEKPAFTGSEFFTESSEFEAIFEGLKEEVKKFTKHINQRGDEMDGITETVDVVLTAEEIAAQEAAELDTDTTTEQPELQTDEVTGVNNAESIEETTTDAIEEEVIVEPVTREQKFVESFMKTTYDEVAQTVLSAFYEKFGDNVYVVQWSPFDKVLVYVNFEDYKYSRVSFVDESEEITFSESESVKPRYLTDDEINTLFSENFVARVEEEEEETNQEGLSGTTNNEQGEASFTEGNTTGDIVEEEEAVEEAKEAADFSETALVEGERAELVALREEIKKFRDIEKTELIDSFEDDLGRSFLDELVKDISKYSYEELDVMLAKEFTRNKKEAKQKNTQRFAPLVYNGGTTNVENEQQTLKRLVDTHK